MKPSRTARPLSESRAPVTKLWALPASRSSPYRGTRRGPGLREPAVAARPPAPQGADPLPPPPTQIKGHVSRCASSQTLRRDVEELPPAAGRGRRLLNRPAGGPIASKSPRPTIPSPARAYAPPTERKRFYQNVSITQGEGGFEINLDHRKLKTPQAKLFTVPSEALAIAVATEWDSQQDTFKYYTMHLTTLCNTSLDNPTQRNKDQLIRAAVKFLDTDTICYRVEEPETFMELQRNEWDPIIEWAEKRYGTEISFSTSIMGPSIPAKSREVLVSHLASYNTWALQGIEFVAAQLKSMVLTLGLIDLRLTVEQAVLLSRLEEEHQIQKWGNIEWAHDY
ncbi:ATP synthase mitochondrial F1 complex assembly factor 2 [Saguinus oedipus]|uniref:ATP synthase mitochondrial F1 complex assembly factor 2 n=1 Tax=Saguinus oedipus TaxID=9490 RepID=A0ABQ9V233_SAGOE|nr:ATP synthase mitochondrial F1 complex assembly factor 2 [Saguinus oedipus]